MPPASPQRPLAALPVCGRKRPGPAVSEVHFAEFRFDLSREALWRGDEAVALTPKASAVLRCLVAERGRLVLKDELIDAVWPDTAVSDASLKVCIREIRRALGDSFAAPRFIATAHRRGYRFIGAVQEPAPIEFTAGAPGPAHLIGRDAQLAELRGALQRAVAGERQTVFVTGEIGIGKTSLIEALLAEVTRAGVALARGRCQEHFGAGEAYLPLLDGLARLCREPSRDGLRAVLRERAPTWLSELPGLLSAEERAALQAARAGGTRERMLRELTDALEVFTTSGAPLVVVLEDLHWSDPSTLDVITRLATRREPARLLLLASYRPVDVILADHQIKAVKQRLVEQRCSREIALGPLSEPDVGAYLSARLDGEPPPGLAGALVRRTDGNPLFMVAALDEWLSGAALQRQGEAWVLGEPLEALEARVPDGLRTLVDQQIERLAADDRAVLEAAALGGDPICAAALAAGLDADAVAIEAHCERLAHATHWMRAAGVEELPDGTASGRYRFSHSLYRSGLAARVPAAARTRLHLRFGEWLLRAHAARPHEVAVAVAHHFEAGRDALRAVPALMLAARGAAARHAHREAHAELSRALALVARLPAEIQAVTRRTLLEQRGAAGLATGSVTAAIEDLEALVAAAADSGAIDEEMRGRLALSTAWSLRDRSRGLAAAADAVARSAAASTDLQVRARAVHAYWGARQHGWRAAEADAVTAAVAAMRADGRGTLLALHLGMHAYFLNLRGEYAAARASAEEALTLAHDGGTGMLAQWHRCWALLHQGEWAQLLLAMAEATRIAERDGHRLWRLVFEQFIAWTLAEAGRVEAARARADAAYAASRAAEHEFGSALGAVVSGFTAMLARDVEAAATVYLAAKADAERDPTAMEWNLRAPLHLGLSAIALARGDADAAAAEAAEAERLAEQANEPTYLALAAAATARSAHAAGNRRAATTALATARRHASRAGRLALARVEDAAAALGMRRARRDDVRADLQRALDDVPPEIAAALRIA
jgi:DNA-binding winged helix-turn-helix (wHTH) protein